MRRRVYVNVILLGPVKKENDEIHEIDGIIRSVGSVIKTEAIRFSNAAKTYDNLNSAEIVLYKDKLI